MNRFPTRALCLALGLATLHLAAQAQKKPEYFFPTTLFDEETATRQLDEGTNTIRGRAYLKKSRLYNYPKQGEKILLFPVTPYLTEFIELRKKYNNQRKQAVMTPAAFMYRIETKFVDEQGGFEYTGIKPGKYYAITWISYWKERKYQVRTGTESAYNVFGQVLWTSPTYEERSYWYDVEREVNGFIEVTGNGQVIPAEIITYKK